MNAQYLHMHCFLCDKTTPITDQWQDVFKYVESDQWCECIDTDSNFDVPAQKLRPARTDTQECICGTKGIAV